MQSIVFSTSADDGLRVRRQMTAPLPSPTLAMTCRTLYLLRLFRPQQSNDLIVDQTLCFYKTLLFRLQQSQSKTSAKFISSVNGPPNTINKPRRPLCSLQLQTEFGSSPITATNPVPTDQITLHTVQLVWPTTGEGTNLWSETSAVAHLCPCLLLQPWQ